MSITRKKKQCKICLKMCYIFSNGRCKTCSQIAYAEKAKEKFAVKKRPKKIMPTQKYKVEKAAERIAMETVWDLRSNEMGECQCAECGCNLGSTFNPYNLAHVLGKGANKAMQSNIDNFILLCADHHHQLDNGVASGMKIYSEVQEIKRKLKLLDSKNIGF